MALQLPDPPVPISGETSADYMERHRAWWREWDLRLRVAQHENAEQWGEAVGPNVAPTLNRIADAWDAFDVRLGELAGALSQGGGLSDEGLLRLLRVVLGRPEPGASGG